MPLLHLAGFNGKNKYFSMVFCFLAKENLDYYTWALEYFNSAISSHHLSPPEIIITDQELALMNDIEKVLPNTIHMLCTWNIEKNILTNASKIIKDSEEVKQIMPHWSNLVKILTPSDFYASFQRFSALYKPQFIK